MLHMLARAYGWGPSDVQQLTYQEARYLLSLVQRERMTNGGN